MKIDFTNKNIVIIGGTRGIGKSILELFLNCNAHVIATGTKADDCVSLNKNIYTNVEYKHLDYTCRKSVNNFLEYLKSIECIDVLINNAGMNKIDYIENINENDWDLMYNINLKGPFLITRSVANTMKSVRRGKIINIASIYGVVSRAKRAAYSASKWGLLGFTKAIALDLSQYNILVNAVSPGFVMTDLTKKILSKDELNKLITEIPLNRIANVNEIAKTVVFLASDLNTYITGQNIIIDGGNTSA